MSTAKQRAEERYPAHTEPFNGHTPLPWTLETVPTSLGVCHKIGPFPWRLGRENHACIYVDSTGSAPDTIELKSNAEFIIHATSTYYTTQAEVERLRGLLEEAREALGILIRHSTESHLCYPDCVEHARAFLTRITSSEPK